MFRKFYLILTAMVVIVAVAIVSCQKFDNKSIDEKSTNSVIQQTKAVGFGVHRKFYNVGKGYCFPPASECWDDIVIVGETAYATLIRKFISVIHKGDNEYMREFTAKNLKELSTDMDAEYLKAVVDGKFILSTKNNPKINTDFIIFTEKGEKEPFIVYPFVCKAVGFGVHRKFYNVGKGYCFPPASECWDDIVIYGETLIKDFLAVIDKGNDKQIAEFTAKYIEELSKYIETEFLHEVIKENLVLSTLNNPEINTDFVIFTKKGDKEPFTVYPFVQK